MKSILLWFLFLQSFIAGLPVVRAQVVMTYVFDGINADIPDADPSGLVDARSLTTSEALIQNVSVGLTLSGTGDGAFNGDFYIYLQHGSEITVLMNRPGRRADDAFGYDDNGLSHINFDDAAPNGDIHNYRRALTGSDTTPLSPAGISLTGDWAPDGREVNPGVSLDTTPRTAMLSRMTGMSANGGWTLFVADFGAGGTARLESWSLTITVVPEPGETALLAGLLALGFAAWRWHRRPDGAD